MRKGFLLIFFALFCGFSPIIFAQKKQINTASSPTNAELRFSKNREILQKKSFIGGLTFENIGPVVMSGRVTDIEVNPDNHKEFFVAYASGGLWYTDDCGQTFKPLFQNEKVITIGDIAVDWAAGTIWVGTGENNSSRSSYAGNGVYKSEDKGATWIYCGLPDSQHISRIILHPTEKNTLWVAVLGHLYSENDERGVFKSLDGGRTWKKVLYISPKVGVSDLVLHPQNPNMLLAATWERIRRAWDFSEAGIGSGIFKTLDGGAKWEKIAGGGFPEGKDMGRIGIAVSQSNPETVYALADNQEKIPPTEKEHSPLEYLTLSDIKKISPEEFLTISEEVINNFLDENNFPAHINAKKVIESVKKGEIKHTALLDFLGNANDNLFNAKIKGAELYRSDDFGKTWRKTHGKPIEDLFYTYGYYFGQVRVHPKNHEKVYLLGVPLLVSNDGGANFENINGENVHLDHHALNFNLKDENFLVNGNDGGVNVSFNAGKSWLKCNSIPVGQFYTVNTDHANPYRVYGGLQDNGVWFGVPETNFTNEWHQTGEYSYKELISGDGMQVMIDPRDNETIYTGYQFGNYYRINKSKGEFSYITPQHQLGEKPLRFNWQTPIWLSRHNPDVLYMGSHRFHRSLKKGENWETLSGDLTRGVKAGDVPYGTISTIHESPIRFGLIYTGTDDGLIHVTQDGGYTWRRISDKLPQELWVSRVWASAHKLGRVYVSLNGYRYDNFESFIYVSDDYGDSWQRIGSDLPFEPVNVIKEDNKNENLLYVGTDNGLYISLDRGKNFMCADKGLPAVAVHDLNIQEREGHLLVATHGRSLYRADIRKLQSLSPEIINKELYLFDIDDEKINPYWGKSTWNQWFKGNSPKTEWFLWAKNGGDLSIVIKSEKGTVVKKISQKLTAGLNRIEYDFTLDENVSPDFQKELNEKKTADNQKAITVEPSEDGKIYIKAGKYSLEFLLGGKNIAKEWTLMPPKKRSRN